jgi:putative N6-adenine-specific DNA methylase
VFLCFGGKKSLANLSKSAIPTPINHTFIKIFILEERSPQYIAKTVSGLEEVLLEELKVFGAENPIILKRAVGFDGPKEVMYRANYSCHTALRILKPLKSFEVADQKALYDNIIEIPWEDFLEPANTLAVDSIISDSVFTNSQYVSLKTKDAVVDRLRSKWGARPSVSLDKPDLRINVHIFKKSCSVALDSSGRSLHKRGYRIKAGLAPLNEVLAAGLIRLSGWDRNSPFVDPMCGSGTLLIEAAMYSGNYPAAYFTPEFGFMKWKDYDPELWYKIKEEEDEKITQGSGLIHGCDISSRAADSARENIRFAKFTDKIHVDVCSFEDFIPAEGNGVVVTNPPYDERLHVNDMTAFYKSIGDVFKKKYTGYNAWVISSDLRALKFIGLHPSKKITVFNGPLECRFVRFNLY